MDNIDGLNRDEAEKVLDRDEAILIRELPTVPQYFETDCLHCKRKLLLRAWKKPGDEQ